MKRKNLMLAGLVIAILLGFVFIFSSCANEDQAEKIVVVEDGSVFKMNGDSEDNMFQEIDFNGGNYIDLVIVNPNEPYFVTLKQDDETGEYIIVPNTDLPEDKKKTFEKYTIKPTQDDTILIMKEEKPVQEMV